MAFGAEKRTCARTKVWWRLLILLAEDKKPGYALDISEGGLRLSSIYSFPMGSRLKLAVFVPDAKNSGTFLATVLECRVLYQVLKESEVQLGVEFLSPSDEAMRRIRAAIALKQQTSL